ncbi:MAG TPA: uroporphyrinogen-III C-methyltransferase [Syntrophales bacterium]|nr:uroporphyrinogen-III C-methyltransferase [Syntrophales bacterium]
MKKKGKVYIIGAGPGDPGLITVRGVECLSRADVVIYDHLVCEDILRHARPEARRIYAGKKGGDHTLPQEEINRLLVEEAAQGRTVARLKGGDPFIFGRGGEEAEVLAAAGVPFEIVPGVTSAIAVPAYSGIPLTHRAHASTLTLVTGHEDPSKVQTGIDWSALARMGTLVFMMGVRNLEAIVKNLIGCGRSAGTPAAVIRWGTTPDQKTVQGTLGDIVRKAAENMISPPAVLVVGEVVMLRGVLNWFEAKPLFGKGVVITRPEEQAREFAGLLFERGARPVLFPTIRIAPPAGWSRMDDALARIASFDWIVFTSANGVRSFFDRLARLGMDARRLGGAKICAIGPATARLVKGFGLGVDLVPQRFISESVVEAFRGIDLKGKRVLLPRAEEARDVIPEGLAGMGADVEVLTAYRTVRSDKRREEFEEILRDGKVDVLVFTSPSTIRCFLEIMGSGFSLPDEVKIACIGPVTAAAARKAGLRIDIMQEEYTIPGMVEALENYYKEKQ